MAFVKTRQVVGVLEFIEYVYDIFGMSFNLMLSTRPEKYLGEISMWDEAEVRFMAKTLSLPYVSTAFVAKTLSLPCVSTAFMAKTLSLPCVSTVCARAG